MIKARVVGILFIAIAMIGCDNGDSGTDAATSFDSGTTDSAIVVNDASDSDGGPVDSDGGPVDPDGGPVGTDGGPIDSDGGPVEVALNGCTRSTATDLRSMAATTITFAGLAYTPKCIVVSTGTAVTFDGMFAAHPLQAGTVAGGTVTAQTTGTPLPTSPRSTGTTATFTMAEAGAFGFYCVPHATLGMNGAIFVE